jgi:hypothetical protein
MWTYKNAIEAIVYSLIACERRKNTLRRELCASGPQQFADSTALFDVSRCFTAESLYSTCIS